VNDFVKAVKSEWVLNEWNQYVTRKELIWTLFAFAIGLAIGETIIRVVMR
jgi:hypothetical protein